MRKAFTYRGCTITPVKFRTPKLVAVGKVNRYVTQCWKIAFPDRSWVEVGSKADARDYIDEKGKNYGVVFIDRRSDRSGAADMTFSQYEALYADQTNREGWAIFDCGGVVSIQCNDTPEPGGAHLKDDHKALNLIVANAKKGDLKSLLALWLDGKPVYDETGELEKHYIPPCLVPPQAN